MVEGKSCAFDTRACADLLASTVFNTHFWGVFCCDWNSVRFKQWTRRSILKATLLEFPHFHLFTNMRSQNVWMSRGVQITGWGGGAVCVWRFPALRGYPLSLTRTRRRGQIFIFCTFIYDLTLPPIPPLHIVSESVFTHSHAARDLNVDYSLNSNPSFIWFFLFFFFVLLTFYYFIWILSPCSDCYWMTCVYMYCCVTVLKVKYD